MPTIMQEILADKEGLEALQIKFAAYLKNVSDPNAEVINVYENPMSKQQLEELKLIREFSRDLQNKKEEDLKKTRQAREEADFEVTKAEEDKADQEEDEATKTE